MGNLCATPRETKFPLDKKIQKVFESIDTDGDGFITFDNFTDYLTKEVHLPPLPEFTHSFELVDRGHTNKISADKFKNLLLVLYESLAALGQGVTVETFEQKYQSLLKKKSEKLTTHEYDIKVGETSTSHDFKTKFEWKSFMNDEDEKKHLEHITQGLNYTEGTVGVIFRLQSTEPKQLERKIKELIHQGKAAIRKIFPDFAKHLDWVEFDTTHDAERITLAIRVNEKCDSFYLLGFLIFLEKYYSQIVGSTTIIAGSKSDFKTLLADTIKAIAEGFLLAVHTTTNSSAATRDLINYTILQQIPGGSQIEAFVKSYLVDGSKVVKTYTPNEFTEEFQFSEEFQQFSLLKESAVVQLVGVVNGAKQTVEGFGLLFGVKALKDLYDMFFTIIKANFSLSVTFPKFVSTIHFKTSGIKEWAASVGIKG